MSKANLFSTSRIYAITPDEKNTEILLAKTEALLQAGIGMLQYRNKAADEDLRGWQATGLKALCESYQVPFIINDHVDLCIAINADGIHLGGTDEDIALARSRLGASKIIGASCYNRLDLALQAQEDDADYVAFGACFPSGTKPNAVKAELSLFQEKLKIPKVAIGGITLQNLQLLQAADAVAIINALYNADNIAETTQHFNRLLKPKHHDLSQSNAV
ncbi:MAG TPA: thiamine phosphate synthase [Methylophilus sp.]|nr:thiamine phosphate synthase [Methylophilus sp.]HQQ32357.1 thiamine phosphate synthase [Methylophilus sp.]